MLGQLKSASGIAGMQNIARRSFQIPDSLDPPFLKTIVQFGIEDEQAVSLNDKSFFNAVDLPFLIWAIFCSSHICSSMHSTHLMLLHR